MLEIGVPLPPGALLNSAPEELSEKLAGTTCFWLEGKRKRFSLDKKTGAITGWQPSHGTGEVRPTEPNTGNAVLVEAGSLSGLRCVTGTHCGLVAEAVTENAARFSMAVIYLPPAEGEARTLLTVNTGYAGGSDQTANYLFLSDGGDAFTVKDTKGAVEINVPVNSAPEAPRLAIVTLSGNALAFQENRGPIHQVAAADPGMHSKADLFIGCRSHRKGLQKTLGGAAILDVFFWPDHTLLLPRSAEDSRMHKALQSYFLWEY